MNTTNNDRPKMDEFLDAFKLAKYRIELKAREPMMLPEFKGSMIRGGFGHVFKRICCASKETSCDGCILRQSCPYAYVFETSPHEKAEHMSAQTKVPRPYIFMPPLDDKTKYEKGDILVFYLTLIGRSIEMLPYFIFSLKELGEEGVTKRRHKFDLSAIYAIDYLKGDEKVIFSSSDNTVHAERAVLVGTDLLQKAKKSSVDVDKIALSFLTPTRIKFAGAYCFNELPMQAIIQNLTLRINALSYFHCSGIWHDDLKDLRNYASNVNTDRLSIVKKNLNRYSSRQQRLDSLSGIVGTIVYAGDFESILPILLLGQHIHVGNDTVYGCGKYEVDYT